MDNYSFEGLVKQIKTVVKGTVNPIKREKYEKLLTDIESGKFNTRNEAYNKMLDI